MEGEDIELLRDYVAHQSEPAFRALVERHVDMVYATALRQVQDAQLAEEATQAVFIDLARKAPGLPPATILAGWLFRAAQFAGAKVQRTEARRKHREQQAAQMQPLASDEESAWDQMAPHLNDALNQLKEPDRDAIVLRFFERKSIAQVGSALGTSESATKMRISRALEQLRGIFQARGIVLPSALLLSALSAHAAPAAPAGLAAMIATSALLKQTTVPILTKGMLLLMASTKSKIAVAAIVALLLLSGTTAFVTFHVAKRHVESANVEEVTSEPTITFSSPGEQTDLVIRERPAKGGRLRMIAADGNVVLTNGVGKMTVVNSDGSTNFVELMEEENGGRRVRRVRVKGPGPGAPGNAGIGGGAEFDAPAPEPPAPPLQ